MTTSVEGGRGAEARCPDLRDAQLARGGDMEAFERLYRRHAAMVHSLARRMLGALEADDAAQRVFVQAWRRLSSYQAEGPFGAWLRQLAVRSVIDHWRSLPAVALVDSSVAEAARTERPSTDSAIAIEAALARLPERARLVLLLHDLEGLHPRRDRETDGHFRGYLEVSASPRPRPHEEATEGRHRWLIETGARSSATPWREFRTASRTETYGRRSETRFRDGERGSAAVRGRPWLVAAAVAGFAAALLGLWLAARSSVVETSPLPKVAKAQPAQTQLLLLEQALDETAAALELEGDDRFLREYLAKLERRRERYLQSAARWGVTP